MSAQLGGKSVKMSEGHIGEIGGGEFRGRTAQVRRLLGGGWMCVRMLPNGSCWNVRTGYANAQICGYANTQILPTAGGLPREGRVTQKVVRPHCGEALKLVADNNKDEEADGDKPGPIFD